jgi:hypothetical protein
MQGGYTESMPLRFVMTFTLLIGTGGGFPVSTAPGQQSSPESPSAEPNSDEVAEQVRRLMQQLDAPVRRTRQAAEERLVELGESALPLLERAEGTSAAAREAVRRITVTIERNAIERLLQASRVTLEQPMTVSKAFEAVSQQTSNPIDLGAVSDPVRERRLMSHLNETPFWKAVETLCEEADLGWEWERGGLLRLTADYPAREGRMAVTDCFRVQATVVSRRGNFARPEVRQVLRVNCRVDVEPRVLPLTLSVEDGDFSISEGDVVLAPFNPEANREFGFTRGQSVLFPIDLKRDPEREPETGTLHGKIRLRCAARRLPITFALDDPDTEPVRAGGIHVRWLSSSAAENGTLTVTLRITFAEEGPELESHRLGLLHRDVWLTSSQGEQVSYDERQLLRTERLSHTVRYTFLSETGLDGATLTYEAPDLISTVTVPIRIERLPLGR